MKKVRVRYAPSPTGLLHIGNARSALFNFLYAKAHKGDFIVRIEDTDISRNVEGGEKSQLDNLAWLGIIPDESPIHGGNFGPYRQLERLDIYQKYANLLLEKGLAYKEYNEDQTAYGIRFKVPSNVTYTFDDIVRGKLSFESKEVEDWIIMKDNGIPTYNFAVVIDDHLMEITHVLRGEEHITNTPKQIMIYNALGFEVPRFGHMTIIVNENKKKLSKRDKDVVQFISEYKSMGYLPEAIFNFISLLGWSPKGEEEILSVDEIIEQFDENRLSKSPAMFDKVKLAYINSRYIKKLSNEQLTEMIKPYLVNANIEIKNDDWLLTLVALLKDRLTHLDEIVDLYHQFFHENLVLEEEQLQFLKDNNGLLIVNSFKNKLNELEEFTIENIDKTIKEVSSELNIKGKPLFMSTRIASTGDMHGPSLPSVITLIGKDIIMNRLNQTLERLKA